MRVVLQRVLKASVMVDSMVVGKIDRGYLLLVGISTSDTREWVAKVADKIASLRVFEDENGKMNLGLCDVGGKILSVSQFTLYADVAKGRRPGFTRAARPEEANVLYEFFNDCLRSRGVEVEKGVFQADMKVELVNDGPVTIILDTDVWV